MLIKIANQIREGRLIACRIIPNILWKNFTHKEVEHGCLFFYVGTSVTSFQIVDCRKLTVCE